MNYSVSLSHESHLQCWPQWTSPSSMLSWSALDWSVWVTSIHCLAAQDMDGNAVWGHSFTFLCTYQDWKWLGWRVSMTEAEAWRGMGSPLYHLETNEMETNQAFLNFPWIKASGGNIRSNDRFMVAIGSLTRKTAFQSSQSPGELQVDREDIAPLNANIYRLC